MRRARAPTTPSSWCERLRALPSLEAAELFYANGLALVCEHTGLPAPFAEQYPAYVLVECAGRVGPDRRAARRRWRRRATSCSTRPSPRDARGRAALWAYRESHTESISAAGVPVKLDVAVPLARASPSSSAALPGDVADAVPGARTILFGHVNEGNLHVNILDALDHDEAGERRGAAAGRVATTARSAPSTA